MTGLWKVPTTTTGSTIGIAVWDALVTAVIIVCTVFCIVRRSKYWPQALFLYIGLGFLSLYGVFNWIDAIIRPTHAKVTYSYVLVDACINAIRVLADVFVLWGVFDVLIRYDELRTKGPLPGSIFGGPLLFLGVYSICMRFAVCFSWLSLNDLHVIQRVAKGRNGFEIAFAALQFVLSGIATIWALAVYDGSANTPVEYKPYAEKMGWGCYGLLLRSFCEVVIVGQLARDPRHLETILRARNVCYHLFSLLFVLGVATCIPKTADEDDPLVKKEMVVVRTARDFVLRTIGEKSAWGTRTAPKISEVLDALKKKDSKSKELQAEVKTLRKEFGGWEPVFKWEGPALPHNA